MTTINQQSIPRHKKLSRTAINRAAKLGNDYSDREDVQHTRMTNAVSREVKSIQRHIINALGTELYEKYRLLVQDESLLLHREYPLGQSRIEEEKKRARRFKRKINNFLRDARVSKKNVISQLQPRFKRIQRLLDVPKHATDAVPVYEVPDAIRLEKTNPWSLYQPAYSGFQAGSSINASKPAGFFPMPAFFTFQHNLDTVSGLVGNDTLIALGNASDGDSKSLRVDTQISTVHTTNRTALIEAWLEFDTGLCHHKLVLKDEFGFSFVNVSQHITGMMHVLHSNIGSPSFGNISHLTFSGAPDKLFFNQPTIPQGKRFWVHLFSEAPIPKNTTVVIRAGIRTVNNFFTNDVEVESETKCKFSFRRLFVRSVR